MNAPAWPRKTQDTDPVRPGRASTSCPERVVRLVAEGKIPHDRQTFEIPEHSTPVATYRTDADPLGDVEISLRTFERVRAGWAPIREIGGYLWDVWRDRNDPTAQVAAPAHLTRFHPATDVPSGVPMRTREAVGTIPPWGTLPAHEVNIGHRVVAGFGYARVARTGFDEDTGRVSILLELPTSILLDVDLFRETVTPYLSITRHPFDGIPVHALSAPLGSHRTIDQSPGHPYGDPR